MDLNLAEWIDSDLAKVGDMLKNVGFKQIDNHAYEIDVQTIAHGGKVEGTYKPFFIVIYPKLLTYAEIPSKARTKKGYAITPWIACRVTMYDMFMPEMLENNIRLLESVILKLPIRPFKDEDAFKGMFTKVQDGEMYTLTFYLNPAYPNGWWDNHTI